jgi:hypothetical protein
MKTKNTEGQSKMDNPEKLATFGTQDTGRRQTKLRGYIFHFFSVLFVFVQCLVYQMLPISLDCPLMIAPQFCLSSSSVLCIKYCQSLWIVHSPLPLSVVCLHPASYVPTVVSFSGLSIID